jgi:iron(III) transport system substrate-binding protein
MRAIRSAVRVAAALAVAAMIAGLVGCGGGKPGARVVVYCAEKEEIIQAAKPLWEKMLPDLEVSVIPAGTNEVVQRIRSERRHPLGDVVWGIGAEGPSALPDLFQPCATREAGAIDPRWAAVAKGQPWQPNNVVPMVLIYNTKMVPASQAPRGWRDLAKPRWKGLLAYAAPDTSGSAYTQLATMVAIFGDNDAGWKTIETIMRHAKILPGSGKVPKGVSDGEYAVGLTYENLAGLYVGGGAPVKIVYPVEGTAVFPDANALIRGAPHPEAGKRFLDFLQSKPVQELLARKLYLRPARKDVAGPTSLPPIDQVKPAPNFNFQWAVAHHQDFLDKWQALLLRLKR